MSLSLDAQTTIVGYWSDGTVNVELTTSLSNQGDLRFNGTRKIIVSCNQGGNSLDVCDGEMNISLPDGFSAASETLTLRIPAGETSFNIDYGEDQPFSVQIEVPEKIVGVDRDVWKCFSDTSLVDTVWEDDQGIGCAAWRSETIQKVNPGEQVTISVTGPDGFVAVFKDVLDELSPIMNIDFELVDPESDPRFEAYIGLTIPEAEALDVYCDAEAFGCADTKAFSHYLHSGRILVYNLWQDLGTDFNDFNQGYKRAFRRAIIHEVVHAFARMRHRSEFLSVMRPEVNPSEYLTPQLTPMDEALLKLHGHPLVEFGMTIPEVEEMVIFNDELLDPQQDARLAKWKMAISARQALREATSARFKIRSSLPGCSEQFGWADYEVGNLTAEGPFFRWVKIDDGADSAYAILAPTESGENEYWRNANSGWTKISPGSSPDFASGWLSSLSDPHYMLENIVTRYSDWSDVEIRIDPNGSAVLQFALEDTGVLAPPAQDAVEITIVIDQETYEISSYRMEWKLSEASCDTYLIEARDVQYDIQFAFPESIRRESDYIDDCIAESLDVQTGFVRHNGSWTRECGQDATGRGYARNYRFSVDTWAYVRIELSSPDDVHIDLSADHDANDSISRLHSTGYLEGGYGIPEGNRLGWQQGWISPGSYTLSAVTYNRVLPSDFSLVVTAQPAPPPPHRFKSISISGIQNCGILLDGTPICWGRGKLNDEGPPPQTSKFSSISVGGHVCALQEDGTPFCWDYTSEGDFTCETVAPRAVQCTEKPPDQTAASTPYINGEGFARRTVTVTNAYYVQTPPAGEKFKAISVGWTHTCALRQDGTPICWGSPQEGKTSPPPSEKFASISSGTSHSCGNKADGTVICWGSDFYGQSSVPQGERFVSVAAGEQMTCGLRADGTTICWGSGGFERCTPDPGGWWKCSSIGGDGIPQSPHPDQRFASLSSSKPHCALRPDGTPECWTKYVSGLGSPPEGEHFSSVSSAPRHACALSQDGAVTCWGNNRFGEASPTADAYVTGEQRQETPLNMVSVSGGLAHTCGIDNAGRINCWDCRGGKIDSKGSSPP